MVMGAIHISILTSFRGEKRRGEVTRRGAGSHTRCEFKTRGEDTLLFKGHLQSKRLCSPSQASQTSERETVARTKKAREGKTLHFPSSELHGDGDTTAAAAFRC